MVLYLLALHEEVYLDVDEIIIFKLDLFLYWIEKNLAASKSLVFLIHLSLDGISTYSSCQTCRGRYGPCI